MDTTRLTNYITLRSGNILNTSMETVTIPVDTTGVTGKGVALSFKRKHPDAYIVYKNACDEKKIIVGNPYIIDYSFQHQFLMFPVKKDWKTKSKISYILDGLEWIKEKIKEGQINSLALCGLGCGLGELDFDEVLKVMFGCLKNVRRKVEIYRPI